MFFFIFFIIFMSLYLIKKTPTIYMLHGLFNIFCHLILSYIQHMVFHFRTYILYDTLNFL